MRSLNNDSYIRYTYYKSFLIYYLNIAADRLLGHNLYVYKKGVMTPAEGNKVIYEMILSGKPFAIARYGGTEARTIADVIYTSSHGKWGGLTEESVERIVNLSGFFPKDKNLLYKFVDVYKESAQYIDILAVWNVFFQTYLADVFTSNAKLGRYDMIEPFYFDEPWSRALQGKKVVVVHPFSETIEKQYSKRSLLFENKLVLPDFDLRTVKAVQILAGTVDTRFVSWFEALDYMYEEVMRTDFDIALVGCGAYGFPLTARIKKSGKQAIHMGGALQILFGIKGNRWDNSDFFRNLYNDSWVRPGENERIPGSSSVENGCYW